MSHALRHCIDVTKTMQQAYNLAQDHAWNGEQELYERRMAEYKRYKALHDGGVLYEPSF